MHDLKSIKKYDFASNVCVIKELCMTNYFLKLIRLGWMIQTCDNKYNIYGGGISDIQVDVIQYM